MFEDARLLLWASLTCPVLCLDSSTLITSGMLIAPIQDLSFRSKTAYGEIAEKAKDALHGYRRDVELKA